MAAAGTAALYFNFGRSNDPKPLIKVKFCRFRFVILTVFTPGLKILIEDRLLAYATGGISQRQATKAEIKQQNLMGLG